MTMIVIDKELAKAISIRLGNFKFNEVADVLLAFNNAVIPQIQAIEAEEAKNAQDVPQAPSEPVAPSETN